MDPEEMISRAAAVIGSILADLAADRENWSSPETFLSLDFEERGFYRVSQDSTTLAATPVAHVRDGIKRELGTDGYDYLLEIPSSAREEIAYTMLDVESGGCAAESYRVPEAIDHSFVARLPLPLPYMIEMVAPQVYLAEIPRLVGRLMDDVSAGRTTWESMTGIELASMPRQLRNAYLDLLAQAAQPAEIRDKLENTLGRRTFSDLASLDETGSANLARSIYQSVHDLRRPRNIDELAGRGTDLPDIFTAVACSAAQEFGEKDMEAVTRAILADVAARSSAWQQLDFITTERLSPLADLAVSGIKEASPVQMHERLLARLGEECLGKIFTLPDKACRHLGNSLYSAARPSPHRDDIKSYFEHWCQRWCDGDRWLIDAIERS
jgi:hypothetical protein